ncbi:P-loop containing nucleoside triphosphate hydrolase protein [Metschnikowia bicuspidata]|uniref:ATP-dependent RNA helicase n=1 Tax=Metschnikowia bicuspidata TaxID=27322 RepID=A0A4P9ZHK0_9ASCO|nr:P-loop containing nucleoside triphosphate hydrolase protein [Metschnikowia bicuspidata]
MWKYCAGKLDPFLFQQCRFYSRRKKQLIPTRKAQQLHAQPTEKGQLDKPKLFAFGNFSALEVPKKKQIELLQTAIENIASFDSLRIFPTVRAAMIKEIKNGYNLKNTYVKSIDDVVIRPSPVQIAAIRKINQPRKVAAKHLEKAGTHLLAEVMEENEKRRLKIFTIAAETGSGKSWAYLASVLSMLKQDDMALFNRSPDALKEAQRHSLIRAVILLPTHELVNQVYDTVQFAATIPLHPQTDLTENVLKSPEFANFFLDAANASSLDLKVFKWGVGDTPNKLFNEVKSKRIDILVTTPGKIQGLARLDNFDRPFKHFNFVDYCVVDEADTLVHESWFEDTAMTLQRFGKLKDLILCSATTPKEFEKAIQKLFTTRDSLIRIVTPQIHKIPKQIVVKVIDAEQSPFHGSKSRCLAQAIYAIHNDGTESGFVKRIIVFLNEKKHVEPLVETLITKFHHNEEDVVGVSGSDDHRDRAEKIVPFINSAEPLLEGVSSKVKVLVTTDLLARGLNFQGIKNVILMDIPKTSIDLIHRIGRTGRMRQSGRVFVIIDRKSKKSWIKGLPRAIKAGATLG